MRSDVHSELLSAPNASLTLAELLADFSAINLPEVFASHVPSDITLDSREVSRGGIFAALSGAGEKRDEYVKSAIDLGASAIIVDGKEFSWRYLNTNGDVIVITIIDLAQRIGDIASRFFGYPSDALTLVGITGTNGKTSCVDYLRQVLTLQGKKAASLGTLGFKIAEEPYCETGMTTMSVIDNHRVMSLFHSKSVTHVAMEVSSHGIDQRRISGLSFDVRALTNITRDHLDYHNSFEAYRDIKLHFIKSLDKSTVINLDDACSREFSSLKQNNQAVTFSIHEQNARIQLRNTKKTEAGFVADIEFDERIFDLNVALMGEFNLQNTVLVIAVMAALEENPATYIPLLRKLKPAPGRLERIKNIFVDYAHTPDALKSALLALSDHCQGSLLVLFGCGGDRDRGKRALMAEMSEQYADQVFVTSDNPRTEDPAQIIEEILVGFKNPDKVFVEPDRSRAIHRIVSSAQENDLVLIAGKGHENYQEIGGQRLSFSDIDEVKRAVA